MAELCWKRSACPYDCPDGCGLLVETDGTTIYRVKGDPEHPVTKGFVCRKMAHYERTVHSPQRITTPLRRAGKKGEGKFVPISWEEAVDEITARWKDIIARHGAQAILPYSYAGTEHVIQYSAGHAFFARLGATQLERTICAKAKDAGFEQIIGTTPGQNPRDLAQCDYIVIWGSNVSATWLHAHSEILQAKKRGAHVVLIETYRTSAAALADELLLVRPGTDAYLALAMDQVLFSEGLADEAFLRRCSLGWEEFRASLPSYTLEEAQRITGIAPEQLLSVARGFAAAASPVILFGTGMSRHKNGAMAVRCVTTVAAVAGAFQKPFGGIVGNVSSSGAFRGDLIERPDFQKPDVRSVNMNQLGTALCELRDPPILSLYVYSSNPACIAPNQSAVLRGLAREDLFTVVHDRFLTDTARYADIMLPADTAMEHADLAASYGNLCIQKVEAVIAPVGQSKSNFETFRLLARAMDFTEPHFSQTNEEMQRAVLEAATPWRDRLDAAAQRAFDEGRGVLLPQDDACAFATKSGKIEFLHPELPEPLPRYIPEDCGSYPLHLVVAPARETLNSSFNERPELTESRGAMTLGMSCADAAARGIADGGRIEVWNDLAKVEFFARVTDGVPEGTVVAEGVYRADQSLNGLTVNALLSEALTDGGRASTLCGNAVDVRPCPAGP